MKYIYYIYSGGDFDRYSIKDSAKSPFHNYVLFEYPDHTDLRSLQKYMRNNCLLEYLILNYKEIRREGFIRKTNFI